MSPPPSRARARALHIDIDSFSFEGFSNGATIQYREMLERFQDLGIDSAVVTVGQARSSLWAGGGGTALQRRWHIEQGVAVGEYLLEEAPEHAGARYAAAIETMLDETRPDLVILNTPPARLEEAELALFEAVARRPARRLCFVPDHLFAGAGDAAPAGLARLKAALAAFELVAPSAFLAQAVRAAGLGRCDLFGNVFSRRQACAIDRSAADCVTFINPHPMKGVDIVVEIARRLPHRRFQIIRAWPYPPVFACDLPNVTVLPFTPDTTDFWRRTAVLIVPSLCREGFGRVVVEAQAHGIPVVTHDIGALREAGGDRAALVEPPAMCGDPVFPAITAAARDRSADRFCAHIEAIFAGDCPADASAARANAARWIERGERDVARLAAPLRPTGIDRPPSVLVLAPHPDDAAFSVGGLLRAWRGAKTVCTIFGRSNFTKAAGFGSDTAGISRRRAAEDARYCQRVGATLVSLALPEASLRRGPCFAAIFDGDAAAHAESDAAVRKALVRHLADALRTPPDILVAPLALGGHCDHALVRDIAVALAREHGVRLALYEDLPYAAELDEATIAEAAASILPQAALLYSPIVDGPASKCADLACYASQLDEAVLTQIAAHAARSPEPCERLWSADLVMPVIARGLVAQDSGAGR